MWGQDLKFDIKQSGLHGQFYAVRREPHSERKILPPLFSENVFGCEAP